MAADRKQETISYIYTHAPVDRLPVDSNVITLLQSGPIKSKLGNSVITDSNIDLFQAICKIFRR